MGLLLVFEEVLRTGGLTSASQRLALSPSAVSHALGRLREIFDDPLFLRRSQALIPTPRALALHAPLARALDAIQRAFNDTRRFAPISIDRLFRVLAFDSSIAVLLPSLVPRLAREAPHARLAFRSIGQDDVRRALREGRADVAIGVFPPAGAEFVSTTLYEEDFVVVARRGHPLFTAGITLQGWLDTEHLVISAAGDLTGSLDDVLATQGRFRRVSVSVPQFLVAFSVVASGNATAAVPATLARLHAAAFNLEIHEPPIAIPSFQYSLMLRRSDFPDAAIDWLVGVLIEEQHAVTGKANKI